MVRRLAYENVKHARNQRDCTNLMLLIIQRSWPDDVWAIATATSCKIYIMLKLTGARSTRSSLEPYAPKLFIS